MHAYYTQSDSKLNVIYLVTFLLDYVAMMRSDKMILKLVVNHESH